MPDRPFDTIDSTLQNPEMAAAFKKHLQSEFSVENMEFHEEVAQFAKDASNPKVTDQQLQAKAAEIFNEFVKPNAARQVNISFEKVNSIRNALTGQGTMSRDQIAGVLDEAHSEVVIVMSKDPFRRFQKSQGFTAAKQEANTSLDQVEALEKLQARERQLKLNPSLGDKAKAMVTSGGMVSMIRDVERERETLEQEIEERTQKLPAVEKIASSPPPPKLPAHLEQESAPLELEEGVVGRGRSKAGDASNLPKPELHKPSVRERIGDKDAGKVGQGKSVSLSHSDDASKASVKDKIKFFEQGGGGTAPPKRGVK